jgi:DNA-binding NarL/FixJ family response regulator
MKRHGALNLTPREELYLRGMCNGDNRQEVAEACHVAVSTVRNTLSLVYQKIGARNATAACYLLGVADQREAEAKG